MRHPRCVGWPLFWTVAGARKLQLGGALFLPNDALSGDELGCQRRELLELCTGDGVRAKYGGSRRCYGYRCLMQRRSDSELCRAGQGKVIVGNQALGKHLGH